MLDMNGEIKFFTLGRVAHSIKKEHLLAHGIVRDIKRYEGGKIKLGVEPIFSIRGFLRTLPLIKLFIPQAELHYLPYGEAYYIEQLFHPPIEEALYLAQRGVDINLVYLGGITGEPAFEELKLAEALQLERAEKGVYKIALQRLVSELSMVVEKKAELDKEVVKQISWMIRELSGKKESPKPTLPKEDMKKAQELGIPVDVLKRGEEALPKGEGLMARMLGRFKRGE